MKNRRFLFQVPASFLIGVAAKTEAEAWLIIRQLNETQFAAEHDALQPFLPGTEVDRSVTIAPHFRDATLLGKECPNRQL